MKVVKTPEGKRNKERKAVAQIKAKQVKRIKTMYGKENLH